MLSNMLTFVKAIAYDIPTVIVTEDKNCDHITYSRQTVKKVNDQSIILFEFFPTTHG